MTREGATRFLYRYDWFNQLLHHCLLTFLSHTLIGPVGWVYITNHSYLFPLFSLLTLTLSISSPFQSPVSSVFYYFFALSTFSYFMFSLAFLPVSPLRIVRSTRTRVVSTYRSAVCELRTCRRCKNKFDTDKNHASACHYHPGMYTGDSLRKGVWERPDGYTTGSGTAERFWWYVQNHPFAFSYEM